MKKSCLAYFTFYNNKCTRLTFLLVERIFSNVISKLINSIEETFLCSKQLDSTRIYSWYIHWKNRWNIIRFNYGYG